MVVAPDVPREQQTIRLSGDRVASFREWAREGTGLTATARVRDPAGRIAFVKNRWSDGWTLPGGAVEPTELPRDAARREVHEEIGLRATVEDPLVVFDQTYVAEADGTARFSASYIVYSASAEGEIPAESALGTTDDEIRAARWFDSPPENLHDGDLLRQYL